MRLAARHAHCGLIFDVLVCHQFKRPVFKLGVYLLYVTRDNRRSDIRSRAHGTHSAALAGVFFAGRGHEYVAEHPMKAMRANCDRSNVILLSASGSLLSPYHDRRHAPRYVVDALPFIEFEFHFMQPPMVLEPLVASLRI